MDYVFYGKTKTKKFINTCTNFPYKARKSDNWHIIKKNEDGSVFL